jgi:hypothetical protein
VCHTDRALAAVVHHSKLARPTSIVGQNRLFTSVAPHAGFTPMNRHFRRRSFVRVEPFAEVGGRLRVNLWYNTRFLPHADLWASVNL